MTAPEIGQFILVRRRPALVRNLVPFGDHRTDEEYHLVDVEYIDGYNHPSEDRLIWEREVGAKIFSALELPDITNPRIQPDEPGRLEAFLNALRWSSEYIYTYSEGSVSRFPIPMLSPWYGAVQIKDYQLYPVLKAMEMPRVNLLLADDVGLGKTIEASFILQELIQRRKIRRVLIICPSSLQIQWQDELRDKFNIEFTVLDSEKVLETQRELGVDANPWTVYPKIITSMDYLKQADVLGRFIIGTRSLLPQESPTLPWDLLIVDEAHNFNPTKLGDEAKRVAMLREVTPFFEHRLFLTATPHNGYTVSFSGLLELLDPVRFQQKHTLDEEDFKHLQLVMIRRMKSELNEGLEVPRFPMREVSAIPLSLTTEERDLYKALRSYRLNAIKELKKIGRKEGHLAGFIMALLTKRLLSCSYSFARTWWNHVEGFDLEGFDYELADESRERAETPVEDDKEKDNRELDAARHGAGWMAQYKELLRPSIEKVSDEIKELGWTPDAIRKNLADMGTLPPDRKWGELEKWIKENLMTDEGGWRDERVIIFTEYKDTLDYLVHRFRQIGLREPEVQVLFGGSSGRHRRLIKEEFNDPMSSLRILIATDVASEGLNLQTACRYVIHYEIPWNPMRLEQRNGRVDRFGQARDVTVFHFWSTEVEDLKFLSFVARKVNTIREDLGSMGLVLDSGIVEFFTTGRVTEDDIESRLDTYRRYARDVQDLTARNKGSEGDYARALSQYQETQWLLGIDEETLASFLNEALKMDGGSISEEGTGEYRFTRIPNTWEDLVRNTVATDLLGVSGAMPKLVFSPERLVLASGGRELFRPSKHKKLLILSHPVMRRALTSFKRRLWSPSGESGLNRWTIVEGALPEDLTSLFVFQYQVSLRNRLGERFQTGVLDLTIGISKDGSHSSLGSKAAEETRKSMDPIPAKRVRATVNRTREQWPSIKDMLLEMLEDLQDSIESSVSTELDKELADKLDKHERMFEERRSALEKQKGPKEIEKLRNDLIKAEEQMLQMTFSEEKNAEHRMRVDQLREKIADAEWERQESHVELLKGRLEKERIRVMERVLPKRYSLVKDGIDVQPIAVKVIVPPGGGS